MSLKLVPQNVYFTPNLGVQSRYKVVRLFIKGVCSAT